MAESRIAAGHLRPAAGPNHHPSSAPATRALFTTPPPPPVGPRRPPLSSTASASDPPSPALSTLPYRDCHKAIFLLTEALAGWSQTGPIQPPVLPTRGHIPNLFTHGHQPRALLCALCPAFIPELCNRVTSHGQLPRSSASFPPPSLHSGSSLSQASPSPRAPPSPASHSPPLPPLPSTARPSPPQLNPQQILAAKHSVPLAVASFRGVADLQP